jgi:hypothetical protein
MDDPLSRAKLFLEQAELALEHAERVLDLSLNENHTNMLDNLLAIAENYYLLHDQFAEQGQLHGPAP